MTKAGSMISLTILSLWTTVGLADDAQSLTNEKQRLSLMTFPTGTMAANWEYSARQRSLYPAAIANYSADWPRRIKGLEFQDSSALSRVSKLRGLSMLTLADFGRTWLFLGVNRRGVVGLHFGPLPNRGGERYLEMARMPYLRDAKRITE